jgi:hypothetical protein
MHYYEARWVPQGPTSRQSVQKNTETKFVGRPAHIRSQGSADSTASEKVRRRVRGEPGRVRSWEFPPRRDSGTGSDSLPGCSDGFWVAPGGGSRIGSFCKRSAGGARPTIVFPSPVVHDWVGFDPRGNGGSPRIQASSSFPGVNAWARETTRESQDCSSASHIPLIWHHEPGSIVPSIRPMIFSAMQAMVMPASCRVIPSWTLS